MTKETVDESDLAKRVELLEVMMDGLVELLEARGHLTDEEVLALWTTGRRGDPDGELFGGLLEKLRQP